MISLKDNESFTLSYMQYDRDQYNKLYADKVRTLVKSITNFEEWKSFFNQSVSAEIERLNSYESSYDYAAYETYCNEFTLISSPSTNCRERVRYAVKKNPCNDRLSYVMWEAGTPSVYIEDFPIASAAICIIMRPLMDYLNCNNEISLGLKAVHFLSSTLGEVVISLIYDQDLDYSFANWLNSAATLRDILLTQISQIQHDSSVTKISIVGRSKKKKIVVGCNYVMENLVLIRDGRTLLYKQVDDGFSNPNSRVNMKALDWICFSVKKEILENNDVFDLLEMYCGNGNHTVALSAYFRKILAVEINKSLCDAAVENLKFNSINNVSVLACDSCKFANRILGKTRYTHYLKSKENDSQTFDNSTRGRNSDTEEYQFSAVLVDPPRCGLDNKTTRAIQQYDHIIYISCNPTRLLENMIQLSTTHEIVRMATFDHFAYTPHLEVGVVLRKKLKLSAIN